VTDAPSGKPAHDPCADRAGGLEIFFFFPGTLIIWVIPIVELNCPVRYCKLGEINIETALAGKYSSFIPVPVIDSSWHY
jgi:hypothetical protein